jgi:hypothetical protein
MGAIRFISGAHLRVREHYEANGNTALGQRVNAINPVLHERDGIYVDGHPHPAMMKDSGIFR